MNIKKILSGPIVWVIVGVVILALAWSALSAPRTERIQTYQGLELLHDGKVKSAVITDGEQRVQLELKQNFITGTGESQRDHGTSVEFFYVAPQGAAVVDAVTEANPPDGFDSRVPQQSFWTSILGFVIPFLIIGLVFWFLMSRMQGGGNRVMGFGKSRAKLISKDMPQVTFADVAGADEAVEELHEIKEFLAEPTKFQAVGAKIPKGVLLYGPPGTGKTLLARAVAGRGGRAVLLDLRFGLRRDVRGRRRFPRA